MTAPADNSLSVVTLPRLLALLAAEEYRGRRPPSHGKGWCLPDIAVVAEGLIRGRAFKGLRDELGRSESSLSSMVLDLRDRGLIWLPARRAHG